MVRPRSVRYFGPDWTGRKGNLTDGYLFCMRVSRLGYCMLMNCIILAVQQGGKP